MRNGKWLFALDLDNTLIYSRKHFHEGWPCVEWIHGEEQAYMSPRTIELLRGLSERLTPVPVTSRSEEQYRRLRFPGGCEPECAVCANGALLLVRGERDAAWQAETDRVIAPWREELCRMEAALSPSKAFIRCRAVDGAYLFVYCAKDVPPGETARSIGRDTALSVIASGKKIYLLPPPLNKGTALERLRARFAPERVMAAGDGEMDVPMLRGADVAIHPAGLCEDAAGARVFDRECGVPFSEFVLSAAMEAAEE